MPSRNGIAISEEDIRSDEKRHFRFLQLDYKTQLMICRIDALRGSGNDDYFINKLLETFEEKSICNCKG